MAFLQRSISNPEADTIDKMSLSDNPNSLKRSLALATTDFCSSVMHPVLLAYVDVVIFVLVFVVVSVYVFIFVEEGDSIFVIP